MASREFLKILSSARLGDVLAQQELAQAYMTGAFKTPIQPANALIWFEKAYFSITNQALDDQSAIADEISKEQEEILIPQQPDLENEVTKVQKESSIKNKSFFSEFLKVFKSKKQFREFIGFIKKGGKLK